jgi:hypothetical protein
MSGTNTASAGPTFSRIMTLDTGEVVAVYTVTLNAPTGNGQQAGAKEMWIPLARLA